MKFGIRLLLLVALLLPLRGTLAAAGALCHLGDPVPAPLSASAVHAPGHDHADHGGHRALADAGPIDGDTAQGASPTCTFCASVCAAPPLPAAAVVVHALLPSGAERFPALSPPHATSAFGAPERPPRNA